MRKQTSYTWIAVIVAGLFILGALSSSGDAKVSSDAFGWLGILLLMCAYFAPAIIAITRGHKNAVGVFWINLFLGFTGVGWVGALIWAVQISNTEKVIKSEILVTHKKVGK